MGIMSLSRPTHFSFSGTTDSFGSPCLARMQERSNQKARRRLELKTTLPFHLFEFCCMITILNRYTYTLYIIQNPQTIRFFFGNFVILTPPHPPPPSMVKGHSFPRFFSAPLPWRTVNGPGLCHIHVQPDGFSGVCLYGGW